MKWVLKALIQKTISFLPNSHRLNYWFQKHITKGVQLTDDYLDDRLIHFKQHLYFYHKYFGKKIAPDSILELGTGWYPIIPICFFLSGARKIYTIDIAELCNEENLKTSLAKIVDYYDRALLQKYVPIKSEKYEILKSLLKDNANKKEILEKLNLTYLVEDARKMSLPNQSIEYITSNNTFEHVYPDILKDILVDFKRVLADTGVMSHFIDMSDHFAHMDRSINIYHFLKFSKKEWDRIDNTIQPQNRWRMVHFRALFAKLGLDILEEKNRPGDLTLLREVKVHEEFKTISETELAISHGYSVLRKEKN